MGTPWDYNSKTPWAAIIGGATNLIGSALNFGSAKKNRELQIQLNRENNQFNAEQAQIQRDWQEDMYNTYQSPSARRRQYEEAGFNPYLAMNGNSVGSGVGSGSSASSAGTPTLQAPQLDVTSFANSMAQVAQAIKLSKEASNVDADHMMNRNFLAAGIEEALSQRDKNQGDTNWFNRLMKDHNFTFFDKNVVRDYWRAYYIGETTRIDLANQILKSQEVNLNLDARTKRVMNAYLPFQQQADLMFKAVSIRDTLSQIDFRNLQKSTERAKAKALIAQAARDYAAMKDLMVSAAGKQLDNSYKSQIYKGLIEATNSTNSLLVRESKFIHAHWNELKDMFLKSVRYSNERERKQAEWYFTSLLLGGVGGAAVSGAFGALGRSAGPAGKIPSSSSYSGWTTSVVY